MRHTEILELLDYDRWANARILGAVAALEPDAFTRDLGNSFPSVRDTLTHILSADWIWLQRWQGASPLAAPQAWVGLDLAGLSAQWDEVARARTEFVRGLDEARLEATIAYTNTRGQPFAWPLWKMIRHVVNHATYHRGQVTTMLRQLGASAVSTDLILFFAEQQAAGA